MGLCACIERPCRRHATNHDTCAVSCIIVCFSVYACRLALARSTSPRTRSGTSRTTKQRQSMLLRWTLPRGLHAVPCSRAASVSRLAAWPHTCQTRRDRVPPTSLVGRTLRSCRHPSRPPWAVCRPLPVLRTGRPVCNGSYFFLPSFHSPCPHIPTMGRHPSSFLKNHARPHIQTPLVRNKTPPNATLMVCNNTRS